MGIDLLSLAYAASIAAGGLVGYLKAGLIFNECCTLFIKIGTVSSPSIH